MRNAFDAAVRPIVSSLNAKIHKSSHIRIAKQEEGRFFCDLSDFSFFYSKKEAENAEIVSKSLFLF
jgi:hypothetical protein